jgi:transcriptional regulator with PAS, ATPase and Fis domain
VELRDIQSSIQQIVSAISAVLKIEVEIADRNLFRIAGTGQIKSQIWKEMQNEDFVYRRCLELGEAVIIEKPGTHEVCLPCIHYGQCKEFGEVCCPIEIDGVIEGVIGLIAFDMEQRERLFSNLDSNLAFLKKMAELIASKLTVQRSHKQQLLGEQKISAVMNYVNNGVILVSEDGECVFINPAARRQLSLDAHEKLPKEMVDQLREAALSIAKKNDAGHSVVIKSKSGFQEVILSAQIVQSSFHERELLIFLDDPEQIAKIASKLTESSYRGFEQMIGNHPSMKVVKDYSRKATNGSAPVLLYGENGTGKAFLAKQIHAYSHRSSYPFVALHCSALPGRMLEEELFGDEASRDNGLKRKKGKIESAHGGTLFLDDITEMPLATQQSLVRFLERKTIQSYGGYLDVKIIAATEKDLESFAQRKLFHPALYQLLSTFTIHIPPLRERKEDILTLATHFMQRFAKQSKKYIRSIEEEVKKIFLSYHWPGNISELSNLIEYAVNAETGKSLSGRSLPGHMHNVMLMDLSGISFDGSYNLRLVEKETIIRALADVKKRGGSKEQAAEMLGIGRATLFRKLQEYQL